MTQYETGYQPLSGNQYEEENEEAPTENLIHHVPDATKGNNSNAIIHLLYITLYIFAGKWNDITQKL